MARIDYRPPKSLERLFKNDKFWNIIIGPVGSAKTTACIFKLFQNAATQTPSKDGIRRTRFVISRTTYAQLKTTVLLDVQYWLRPVIRWRPSDSLILIDQPPIYSEWFFIPLESPDDQRRLLSMQLSGAWFNEAREVPMELIWSAAGRIPRYPPATEEGVRAPIVLMDSNPGRIGSDLYEFCQRILRGEVDNALYIHQPSGLSPEADWRRFLAPDYYERLAASNPPRWVDVFVHGRWGLDESGEGVYARSFDPDVHVADAVAPIPGAPVVIGIDPGRQPGAVLTQIDDTGTLLVLREAHASNLPLRIFLAEHVRPWLRLVMGCPVLLVMDPAGRNRASTRDESPYSVAKEMGFDVVLSATNDVDTRVRALDRLLVLRGERGRAMIRLDRKHCPTLIDGMLGAYRYQKKKDNVTLDPRPLKTHPVSDVVDALQYVAMFISGHGVDRVRDRAARTAGGQTFETGVDLTGWS
jgi:hypothetical protein